MREKANRSSLKTVHNAAKTRMGALAFDMECLYDKDKMAVSDSLAQAFLCNCWALTDTQDLCVWKRCFDTSCVLYGKQLPLKKKKLTADPLSSHFVNSTRPDHRRQNLQTDKDEHIPELSNQLSVNSSDIYPPIPGLKRNPCPPAYKTTSPMTVTQQPSPTHAFVLKINFHLIIASQNWPGSHPRAR